MAILQRPPMPFAGFPLRLARGKLLLAFALAGALGLGLFQVNQFSHLTSASYELNALNQQRAEKQARNHGLEAEVATLSSLARVEWEARTRLGMGPPSRTVYINVNQPLPARESLPTRFGAVEPPDAAASGRSFLAKLRDLLRPF